MHTIQVYRQVSSDRVVQFTKPVSLSQQRRVFERYAKSYRLAYGSWPSDISLSVEVRQYGGITLQTLFQWLIELKNNSGE